MRETEGGGTDIGNNRRDKWGAERGWAIRPASTSSSGETVETDKDFRRRFAVDMDRATPQIPEMADPDEYDDVVINPFDQDQLKQDANAVLLGKLDGQVTASIRQEGDTIPLLHQITRPAQTDQSVVPIPVVEGDDIESRLYRAMEEIERTEPRGYDESIRIGFPDYVRP
jgi:hypothetical protein